MTHRELVEIAGRWLRNTRHCGVVLLERGVKEIPDAIGWVDGHAVVVEVKTSRSDFNRDAQKCHRRGGYSMGGERWFLAPTGILDAADVSGGEGLLEWNGRQVRRRVRAALTCPTINQLFEERRLLLSELRIYHAQGITYRTISEQKRLPAREPDLVL